MKKYLLTAIAAVALAVACNNNTSNAEEKATGDTAAAAAATPAVADSTKLNGDWQLNFIEGMAVKFDSMYANKVPHILFDLATNRFSGNTGCNNFSGELELSGNAISFLKPMIMTKMFCQGDGEPFFMQNLQKVTSWAVSNDTTLHFKAAGKDVMRFSKRSS